MPGNALLIAVVYKNANQRMRTASKYFIFNMACANVLRTLYSVQVTTVSTAYSHQWLRNGLSSGSRMNCFAAVVTEAHATKANDIWQNFRDVRKCLKKKIREARQNFIN